MFQGLDSGVQVTTVTHPVLIEVDKAMRVSKPIQVAGTSLFNSDKVGRRNMGSGIKAEFLDSDALNVGYHLEDWIVQGGRLSFDLMPHMGSLQDGGERLKKALGYSSQEELHVSTIPWSSERVNSTLTQDHLNMWLILYSKMYEVCMFYCNHPQKGENSFLSLEFSSLKGQMEDFLTDAFVRVCAPKVVA